ncbi:hypothetical protein N801_14040 [Knoellia aerolata DSM 18566]|uniref:Uncharacterized protein n=1 Tax=Knoellia aerolata DSM 18566 TaxID=1385519 RepID=A0A0A0JZ11_9MICO|nr:hypothetical protein N801_14040 [Knoellia aerolata DSM 18566]
MPPSVGRPASGRQGFVQAVRTANARDVDSGSRMPVTRATLSLVTLLSVATATVIID